MSPEDEERDHDQVLMDAVFETVDELAKVYAEGFADLCAGLRVWPDQCRPPPPDGWQTCATINAWFCTSHNIKSYTGTGSVTCYLGGVEYVVGFKVVAEETQKSAVHLENELNGKPREYSYSSCISLA